MNESICDSSFGFLVDLIYAFPFTPFSQSNLVLSFNLVISDLNFIKETTCQHDHHEEAHEYDAKSGKSGKAYGSDGGGSGSY